MARRSLIPAAITEMMAHSERHAWTLEELQDGLGDAGKRADFSSVFRAMRKLVADGSVRKLSLEDGRVCFEPVSAHHDHLQCTRCGTLVPVPCAIPKRTLAAVEARNGVTITDHRVIFMGLCSKCRAAAGRRKKAS
ncbi:MAG TPA: transcriptional repressor [Stellaceae bacterium]|nr:transcriptional repressor [Stellaceae bacterium]